MDANSSSSCSPLSLQPNGSSACTSTAPCNHDHDPTVHNHLPSSKTLIRKNKKKKKAIDRDAPSSSSSSIHKGTILSSKRRFVKVRFGSIWRPEVRDIDSIALPLGMSFAAVVAQVLEKVDATNQRLSPDYFSLICTSAVKGSLANVFRDKFDSFVMNFEKSFGSTLRTLRLINNLSKHKEKYMSNPNNAESSSLDETSCRSRCHRNSYDIKESYSEVDLPSVSTWKQLNIHEDVQENIQTDCLNRELAIHGQVNQPASVNPRTGFGTNLSMVSTIEKSVIEQVRSNDLKTLELSLTMRKLKLKEEQLALNSNSNYLERLTIAMGISKASFKAEKLKSQVEETKHAELLRKCIDCLVAGLLIMSFLLIYDAYVYSYKRITDATSSCSLSVEITICSNIISRHQMPDTLKCQVQVLSRMMFGVMLILVVTYLLIQRSGTSKQTMPITFILLLLGILWFGWEVLCRYVGRRRILLALLLGDSMPFAFPLKC